MLTLPADSARLVKYEHGRFRVTDTCEGVVGARHTVLTCALSRPRGKWVGLAGCGHARHD